MGVQNDKKRQKTQNVMPPLRIDKNDVWTRMNEEVFLLSFLGGGGNNEDLPPLPPPPLQLAESASWAYTVNPP